jgi:hypothetical protein
MSAVAHLIQVVLRPGTPRQVGGAIVPDVTIVVPDFKSWWTWAMEGERHQMMHTYLPVGSTTVR